LILPTAGLPAASGMNASAVGVNAVSIASLNRNVCLVFGIEDRVVRSSDRSSEGARPASRLSRPIIQHAISRGVAEFPVASALAPGNGRDVAFWPIPSDIALAYMSALGGTAKVAGRALETSKLGLRRRSCLIHFACRGGYQTSDFIH
jgi:hypothetical protein